MYSGQRSAPNALSHIISDKQRTLPHGDTSQAASLSSAVLAESSPGPTSRPRRDAGGAEIGRSDSYVWKIEERRRLDVIEFLTLADALSFDAADVVGTVARSTVARAVADA